MTTGHLPLRAFLHGPERRGLRSADIDPADMGTCFGMEMTLASAAASAASVAGGAGDGVARSAAPTPRWWQRRGRR
ncbi:MAG: hypothetical protein ABI696_11665 [Rubrivivax sp.]